MRFVPFAMENAFVCQIEILSLDEQVADGFMFQSNRLFTLPLIIKPLNICLNFKTIMSTNFGVFCWFSDDGFIQVFHLPFLVTWNNNNIKTMQLQHGIINNNNIISIDYVYGIKMKLFSNNNPWWMKLLLRKIDFKLDLIELKDIFAYCAIFIFHVNCKYHSIGTGG